MTNGPGFINPRLTLIIQSATVKTWHMWYGNPSHTGNPLFMRAYILFNGFMTILHCGYITIVTISHDHPSSGRTAADSAWLVDS